MSQNFVQIFQSFHSTRQNTYKQPIKFSNNIENTILNLIQMINCNKQDIKQCRKLLKDKINRNQFNSKISTKLSLSEIRKVSNNMNQILPQQIIIQKNNKQIDQLSIQISSFQNKIYQQIHSLQNKINTFHTNYSNNITIFTNQSNQISILKQQLQQRDTFFTQINTSKADRSQLQKLFHLNKLLIIELEQLKQRSNQFEINLQNSNSNLQRFDNNINQLQSCLQDQIDLQRYQNKMISKFMEEKIMEFSKQIDKNIQICTVLQQEQQNNWKTITDKQRYIECQLQNMKNDFKMKQNNQILTLREIKSNLNIYELRQNQLSRALKEIQEQKQNNKKNIQMIYLLENKIKIEKNQISNIINLLVKNYVENSQSKIYEKIQNVYIEIMGKIVEMSNDCLQQKQFQRFSQNIQNKYKCIETLDFKIVEKMVKLQSRINEQNIEIGQLKQKNQQISEKIKNQLNQGLKVTDFKQIIQKYASSHQLKENLIKANKYSVQILDKFSHQQSIINQALCSQNIIGRWAWNNGEIKQGNLIAWDKQVINTLPENFKLNTKQQIIHVMSSGLYRIQMGFYSKKKPTVQIIVNGITVVSAVNSNSYVLHHSSGKLKDLNPTEITGITFIDFFLLPEKSRIAISYIGDYIGQGFLGVQKL